MPTCSIRRQGLLLYSIPDGELLTVLCRAYNDWLAEFCQPFPAADQGHRHAEC